MQLFPRQALPTQDINLIYHRREYMPENMLLVKDFIKQRSPKLYRPYRNTPPSNKINDEGSHWSRNAGNDA
ncbi:MAG: hypothetical protein HRU20_31030 [Pseudomonadales bacterium]|nr:hypothetical protein [Pseudomonadales bacterium]